MRNVLFLGLLAASAAFASAPRPNAHDDAEKFRAWRSGAARALIARADANSLATAAALAFPGNGTKADSYRPGASPIELASRAAESAPQSVGIGWLRLRLCAETPGCDIRDVATVMRWVDPDNGAVWLPTLAAAERDKDTTEVDRVLADMARGGRFDVYQNRIAVLMFDALRRVRNELPPGYAASDAARLTAVTGIVNSEIIPPFTPLMEACREPAAAVERRDLCLKLSKTMQRGDTIAAQLMGFTIERHLVAPDSKEARTAAERRHLLEWRAAAAAQIDTPPLPWMTNARARARIAQMRKTPREEDVCMAILRAHKMVTEPPEPRT